MKMRPGPAMIHFLKMPNITEIEMSCFVNIPDNPITNSVTSGMLGNISYTERL